MVTLTKRSQKHPQCRTFCFFFFQAEDGIRDDLVTGVQTCDLPISLFYARIDRGVLRSRWQLQQRIKERVGLHLSRRRMLGKNNADARSILGRLPIRSEERRVGQECRSRWSTDQ